MQIKYKKIISCLVTLFIIVSLSGCNRAQYPIYKKTDVKGEGVVVEIDGVIYKMLDELKWNVMPDNNIIGYAGNSEITISGAKGDTERNFIFLHVNGSSLYSRPLCRTDKIIPNPSKENVNILKWFETRFNNNVRVSSYVNSNEEKTVVNNFFDILNTNKLIDDGQNFKNYRISISCYSNDIPGAYYELVLLIHDGKIICGNTKDKYIEIPIDLLEKISGKKININELTDE